MLLFTSEITESIRERASTPLPYQGIVQAALGVNAGTLAQNVVIASLCRRSTRIQLIARYGPVSPAAAVDTGARPRAFHKHGLRAIGTLASRGPTGDETAIARAPRHTRPPNDVIVLGMQVRACRGAPANCPILGQLHVGGARGLALVWGVGVPHDNHVRGCALAVRQVGGRIDGGGETHRGRAERGAVWSPRGVRR